MFIALGALGVKYGLTLGHSNKFSHDVKDAQGQVIAFQGGIIAVEFDKPIINVCGDTSIYTFATTPSMITVQLKPIFIPEAKAQAFVDQSEGNLILFPIYDVYPFFMKTGIYKIEVFVENDCSGINSKSIALDPIALIINEDMINKNRNNDIYL